MIFRTERNRMHTPIIDQLSIEDKKTRIVMKANTDDYIPLASLNIGSTAVGGFYRNTLTTRRIKDAMNGRFEEAKIERFMQYVKTNCDKDPHTGTVDIEKEMAKIMDDSPYFKPRNPRSGGHTYAHLFSQSEAPFCHSGYVNMRNDIYYTNAMFVGKLNRFVSNPTSVKERKMKPIWSIMTKRENYNYLRMCYVANVEPVEGVLEFWIRSDVDVTRGNYKNLRSRYRKHLKPKLIASNIQIREFDDLDIFRELKTPSFRTPSAKRDWAKEIAKETILAKRNDQLIRSEGSFNLLP